MNDGDSYYAIQQVTMDGVTIKFKIVTMEGVTMVGY